MNPSHKDMTRNAQIVLFKLKKNLEQAEKKEKRLLSELDIVRKDIEKINLEKQSFENKVVQHEQMSRLQAKEYLVSKQALSAGLKLRPIVDLLDFSQPPPDFPQPPPEHLDLHPFLLCLPPPPLPEFHFPPQRGDRQNRIRSSSTKRSQSRSKSRSADLKWKLSKFQRSSKEISCRRRSRSRDKGRSRRKNRSRTKNRNKSKSGSRTKERYKSQDRNSERKIEVSEEKRRSLKENCDWTKGKDYCKPMSRSSGN